MRSTKINFFHFFILLFLSNNYFLVAQNTDCPTAVFLCNENTFSVAGGAYSGGGIAESPGCWFGTTDLRSHWYTFSCTQSGTFTFSCIPLISGTDFDFALYNITCSGPGVCNLGTLVSCNYALPGGNGTTGIGCANGAGCSGAININLNQTYALLINRFSAASTSGFTLSFGGTSQLGMVAAFTNTTACAGMPVQFTNCSSKGVGVTYSWEFGDGGISTVQNPSHIYANGGIYNAQLIVSNGTCSDTIVHQVIITTGPTVTIAPFPSVICAGQSVALTANGAATYTWSPTINLTASTGTTVTASPQVSTTYTITGTTNGCTGTATAAITISALTTVNSSPAASTICAGDSVLLTGSGANTYSWSPSSGLNISTGSLVMAAPSVTTTYVLTGTNAAGCNGFDTTIIIVNPQPTISFNPVAPSICIGGNILITTSGANIYSWSPSIALSATNVAIVTATPTVTSTYSVFATDINGCTNTNTVVVTVNPLPVIAVIPIAPSICSGDSVVLNASGGSTYSWSPSTGLNNSTSVSVTASPLTNTTYTLIGTSGVGCSAQTTVAVNVLPNLTINILPSNPTICSGASVSVTSSGAASYVWSPSSGLNNSTSATVNASPDSTTNYSVIGTGTNGCTAASSTIITVNTLPIVTINPGVATICFGENIQLNAIGANSYLWTPAATLNSNNISNPIATPVASTIYTVIGTDANGCSTSAYTDIFVNPLPIVTVNSTSSMFCPGASVVLTASGAVNYLWSPSTGLNTNNTAIVTATPANAIGYSVTGTDANGCSATAYSTLTLDPFPIASYSVFLNNGCEPLIVQFENTSFNGVTAAWSFGDGSSGNGNLIQHNYFAGTYDVIMIAFNASGCADTSIQNAAVTVLPTPTAYFNMNPPAPGNFPYTDNLFNFTNTSSGAITYNWNFGDNTSDTSFNTTHSFGEPGEFYVVLTAFASNGCSDTAHSPIIIIEGEPKPWIPSAFTPNNDGANDLFMIYGIAIATLDFKVFDRWGELVFQTKDYSVGWDGNFHGLKSSTDVYVYVAEVEMLSGEKYLLKGDVTLIR